MFALPILFILKRKRFHFLFTKLNLYSAVLILLLIAFVFAPLAAGENPDFQKNIGMTRLLPPLSSVNVLHLSNNKNEAQSDIDEFIVQKGKVVKNSFTDEFIYIDSLTLSAEIFYYQKGLAKEIDKDEILFKGKKPVITSRLFILGTDEFGRDIFSRLIYGARISLSVGLGAVIISLIIGLILGYLSGYIGGFFDIVFSRITDMFLAFPIIFLVILILALFGNTILSVIIVLGFSGWMSLFKIVKGEVISIKQKDYFISARLLGLSKTQLLLKEVLPVMFIPVTVNIVFQFGNVILAESALSYLGLGTGINFPSWGAMIESGQEYLSHAWWMIIFPGSMLVITLLTANNLGRELNKIYNPRV
jgi:peptide/nickel transport system permease protein